MIALRPVTPEPYRRLCSFVFLPEHDGSEVDLYWRIGPKGRVHWIACKPCAERMSLHLERRSDPDRRDRGVRVLGPLMRRLRGVA